MGYYRKSVHLLACHFLLTALLSSLHREICSAEAADGRRRQQQQRNNSRRPNNSSRSQQQEASPADYYGILGVSKRSKEKDIKSAYRKLALKVRQLDRFKGKCCMDSESIFGT